MFIIRTISAVCPRKVWKHLPVSAHQSLHVLSKEPVAILSLSFSKRQTQRAVERWRFNGFTTGSAAVSWLPVGVVEGDGVHHVPVTLQRVQLCARGRVPDPARPVIAPREEPAECDTPGWRTRHTLRACFFSSAAASTHLDPDLSKATFVSGRMWALSSCKHVQNKD